MNIASSLAFLSSLFLVFSSLSFSLRASKFFFLIAAASSFESRGPPCSCTGFVHTGNDTVWGPLTEMSNMTFWKSSSVPKNSNAAFTAAIPFSASSEGFIVGFPIFTVTVVPAPIFMKLPSRALLISVVWSLAGSLTGKGNLFFAKNMDPKMFGRAPQTWLEARKMSKELQRVRLSFMVLNFFANFSMSMIFTIPSTGSSRNLSFHFL
mmetsp:Transcript_5742/g.11404  ORF Transcript_5742/g.11404 Transcript_5742/m.11404 type:complete len:208 (-) Transcript_5742:388-1011(-)